MKIDPQSQIDLFQEAVSLLGGSRTAARELGVGERTITRLCNGTSLIHEGFLRDMAAALLRRADALRALEERLNPDFSDNLIKGQPREDGRRARWQRERGE